MIATVQNLPQIATKSLSFRLSNALVKSTFSPNTCLPLTTCGGGPHIAEEGKYGLAPSLVPIPTRRPALTRAQKHRTERWRGHSDKNGDASGDRIEEVTSSEPGVSSHVPGAPFQLGRRTPPPGPHVCFEKLLHPLDTCPFHSRPASIYNPFRVGSKVPSFQVSWESYTTPQTRRRFAKRAERKLRDESENIKFAKMSCGDLQLPPGFRFHPTDEELVVHYLCRRCAGLSLAVPIITEIDLYKYDPWQLPGNLEF